MYTNSNIDLVNMNTYTCIKFGQIHPFVLKILRKDEILMQIKDHLILQTMDKGSFEKYVARCIFSSSIHVWYHFKQLSLLYITN